jgi:predicted DCC family thiol-disulfide oxidoreductase YuxK
MMTEKPVILFDGVCNFCNAMTNFIIRQDKKQKFLFATLQSNSGKKLLEAHKINWKKSDSFVMIENDKAYIKSNAALKLYNKLPWYWKWTQLFWIFPAFLRDAVYNLIANNRYKWFGKKEECMVPTPELKARFLD